LNATRRIDYHRRWIRHHLDTAMQSARLLPPVQSAPAADGRVAGARRAAALARRKRATACDS
jgi:hypothetical protein